MLSIRLRRTGSTKRPYYRVVVADSRSRREGRFVEILGHYDPRTDPVAVTIDTERAQQWIAKGARPSETVRKLLTKAPSDAPAAAPSEPEAVETPKAPEKLEAAETSEAEA